MKVGEIWYGEKFCGDKSCGVQRVRITKISYLKSVGDDLISYQLMPPKLSVPFSNAKVRFVFINMFPSKEYS